MTTLETAPVLVPHRSPSLRWSWGLLANLVARNLRVKYQRSALGFVWTLLNPLLTVGVLIAVFHYVVRIQVPHYWAFLLSGYFVWSFTLQTLTAATTVLPEHAHLARSLPLPSEVLITATVLSRLVEFLAELALVLILLAAFHHGGVPAGYLWLPALILLQVALVLGLTLPIATLSAFFHDVQHALPLGLMVLFYVSPVFYPASLVPERLRPWYQLNPFAGLLTAYQSALYQGHAPAPGPLALTAAEALVIAGIGYAIFRRYRALLPEIV
ncbi:MAG TPA: ABC transporter permease [Thermoanaerobaculia bacterium]|jgi:ABC-type polysaccharide/polyol phosphate export permease|nr:ABC transporter permease [Thermoanaerobaculia bacterium]